MSCSCVTGASQGIGAEICVKLANAGHSVIGLARRAEKVRDLSVRVESNCRGIIVGRKCDVQNENDIKESFNWVRNKKKVLLDNVSISHQIKKEFGKLDIFINNAGMMITKFLIEDETENFRKMFDVNVIATCICLKEAVKLIKETSGKGHIIVMNSILGHRVPDIPFPMKPSFGVYPATKFALSGLCQTLRQELSFSHLPIKVTSISPGMVESEMLNNMNQELIAVLPKLKVEDVADAVCYAVNTPERVRIDEIIINPMLQ